MRWWISIAVAALLLGGCTTLHTAAKKGNVKAIDRLIEDGENINLFDEEGMSPLVYAISYNQKESFDTLLNAGADINQKDPLNGNTPLHEAVMSGNRHFIAQLLSKGADPKAKNKNGLNPLMIAEKKNNLAIRALFLPYFSQSEPEKIKPSVAAVKQEKIEPVVSPIQAKPESKPVLIDTPTIQVQSPVITEPAKVSAPQNAGAMLDKMIERRETMGIRNYLDQYPEALESIKEVRQRIRYVGPSGMRIIDILEKRRNKKMTDEQILQTIASSSKAYKKFSAEEREILGKYGLPLNMIETMEKVTEKEEKNVH